MKYFKSNFLFSSIASIILLNNSFILANDLNTNELDLSNEESFDTSSDAFVSYNSSLTLLDESISRSMYSIYYTNEIDSVVYKAIPIPHFSDPEGFDFSKREDMFELKKDLIDFYIFNKYEDFIVDLIDYSYFDFQTVDVTIDDSFKKESAELLKHYNDSKKLSEQELSSKVEKSKFFNLKDGAASEELFPYKNSSFDFSQYSSYYLENKPYSEESKNNKYGPHYVTNNDFNAITEHPDVIDSKKSDTPSINIKEPSEKDLPKENLLDDTFIDEDNTPIKNNFSAFSLVLGLGILGLAIFFLLKNKKRKEV